MRSILLLTDVRVSTYVPAINAAIRVSNSVWIFTVTTTAKTNKLMEKRKCSRISYIYTETKPILHSPRSKNFEIHLQLWRVYYEQGTVLRVCNGVTHLPLTATLRSREHFSLSSTDGEVGPKRGHHSKRAERGLGPRQSRGQACTPRGHITPHLHMYTLFTCSERPTSINCRLKEERQGIRP